MSACISGPNITVSDEDLRRISDANPGWHIERTDDGALLVSPPTSTNGGAKELEAGAQLLAYARANGGKAYSAATGFKTPAGGVVSPDAAWVRAEIVERLRDTRSFWPIMPDIAIEIRSDSDSWPELRRKIDKYIADGARYAIAIDPETSAIYERGTKPKNFTLDIEAIVDA